MSKEKPILSQEELLWKIYESTEKTRKYIVMGQILSVIRILIIIIPIILAIIYLPPLIKKTIQPYQELLETSDQGKNMLQNLDLQNIINQYK